MMINQNSSVNSRNTLDRDELASKVIEVIDAINYLDYAKTLFDMAREIDLDGSEESVRVEMLLEAYEMRYNREMGEVKKLANELLQSLAKPQPPTLTLVG